MGKYCFVKKNKKDKCVVVVPQCAFTEVNDKQCLVGRFFFFAKQAIDFKDTNESIFLWLFPFVSPLSPFHPSSTCIPSSSPNFIQFFSLFCPPSTFILFSLLHPPIHPHQLKQAGTMCRGPAGACDLPEYCTGGSPYCPANVYLLDGSSCQSGQAYCYNGMCLTHEAQCLQLWGYGERVM